MPDKPPFLFMQKAVFPREIDPSGHLYLTYGQLTIDIGVRDFSMSDDPYDGKEPNRGYYGFTPRIKEIVAKNVGDHASMSSGRKGVKELYGIGKGKTAIICGSGRSILKAAESIPPKGDPAHDDLIVIALNSSGVALGADKVDYLFALDFSARALDNPECGVKSWYPEELRSLPIVLSSNTPGVLCDLFADRYYFAGPDWTSKQDRADFGFLDIGGIASFSAAHLAYKMGVERVIWIGHDFAYMPDDGKVWNHFDEPMTADWQIKHNVGYATGYDGSPVPCDERLHRNMRCVAGCSYMMADQGIEVINATGFGTLGIHQEPEKDGAAGVYTMDLKDALERIQSRSEVFA